MSNEKVIEIYERLMLCIDLEQEKQIKKLQNIFDYRKKCAEEYLESNNEHTRDMLLKSIDQCNVEIKKALAL